MRYGVGDRVIWYEGDVPGVVVDIDRNTDMLAYRVQWDNLDYAMWMTEDEISLIADPSDAVNHPAHYNTGKIEVIDFIEDQGLEYHEANALKYISRAGKKNPDTRVEDLEKAVWYLNRKIALLKGENDG